MRSSLQVDREGIKVRVDLDGFIDPFDQSKDAHERRLSRAFGRMLADWEKKIRAFYNARNVAVPPPEFFEELRGDALLWVEPELVSMLDTTFEQLTDLGHAPLVIPYTSQAAQSWASSYSFEFLKDLESTTISDLRRGIARMTSEPGTTIGDVMDSLGPTFSASRAEMIATTETTRAFAKGEIIAGQAMLDLYENVRMIKTWFTNNDDRVCPICEPLHALRVELNDLYEGWIDHPPAHPRCRCWHSVRSEIVEVPQDPELNVDNIATAAIKKPNPNAMTKESEEWARNIGIRRVDYSRLSIEQARAANDGLYRAIRANNQLIDDIHEVRSFTQAEMDEFYRSLGTSQSAGETRAFYFGRDRMIGINSKLYQTDPVKAQNIDALLLKDKKRKTLLEAYLSDPDTAIWTKKEIKDMTAELAEINWRLENKKYVPFSTGRTRAQTMIHETGHALEWQIKDLDGDLYRTLMHPDEYKAAARKISKYAGANGRELIAESWTLYIDGNRDDIHEQLLKIFDYLTGQSSSYTPIS